MRGRNSVLRVLTILLAAIMLLGAMPLAALANELSTGSAEGIAIELESVTAPDSSIQLANSSRQLKLNDKWSSRYNLPRSGTDEFIVTTTTRCKIYFTVRNYGAEPLFVAGQGVTGGYQQTLWWTAPKAGRYSLTVSRGHAGPAYNQYQIKATIRATGVTASGRAKMTVGDITQASAKVTPSYASNKSVTWKSSNTAVATVSATGVVTAKKAGTATITATAKDGSGKKGSYKVTVVAKKAPQTKTQPVYWLQHKKTGENLYTTNKDEVKELSSRKKTWTNKGIKWYAPTSGKPVYRLNFKNGADHHYVVDLTEVNTLLAKGNWKIDNNGKPMFYSGGNVRIYRMNSDKRASAYNKGQRISGFHMFATSSTEAKRLKSNTWKWNQDKTVFKAVKVK